VDSNYISPYQASRTLGVSTDVLYRACKRGLVPGAIQANGHWQVPVEAVEHCQVRTAGPKHYLQWAEPSVLSVGTFAQRLGVNASSVYAAIRENKLPAQRIDGHWQIDARWLNSCEPYITDGGRHGVHWPREGERHTKRQSHLPYEHDPTRCRLCGIILALDGCPGHPPDDPATTDVCWRCKEEGRGEEKKVIVYARSYSQTVSVITDCDTERDYRVVPLDEGQRAHRICTMLAAANQGTLVEFDDDGTWRYAANGFEHRPVGTEDE